MAKASLREQNRIENIGTIGHVDHGKTPNTAAITKSSLRELLET